jgi:hypothetical protein
MATNKKGEAYNAQTDDDILKQLKDVNSNWNKKDFIITNTKITVGVNYELKDFDLVFLSIANFNSARDLTQVSMRCRTLKENLIKVVLLESQNGFNTFKNDDYLVANCPIYKNLVKDILIEKHAPLHNSFKFLCLQAGYKFKVSNDIMRKDLDNYFNRYYAECEISYSYEMIPDITEAESQEINKRIYATNATLEDKISQKKYFYKLQFKNIDEDILAIGWEKRYNSFFDSMKIILNDPENNLYTKIKNYNQWDSIFPSNEELNKVKLNDELVDEIFTQYHFKDLSKASKAKAIIKHIYNSYFGKNIIESITKDKKNYKLNISDETRTLYYYSLESLKIYKREESNIVYGDDMFNDEDEEYEIKEEIKKEECDKLETNKHLKKICIDFNNF